MYQIMMLKSLRNDYKSLYQYYRIEDGDTVTIDIETKEELDTVVDDLINNRGYAVDEFMVIENIDFDILVNNGIVEGEITASQYEVLLGKVNKNTSDIADIVANGVGGSGGSGVSEEQVNSAISSYWNEHKTELKGAKGDTGEQGAKGDTGANGYTPIKGTDYYTEAEKTELIEEITSSMPSPTNGKSAYQIAVENGYVGTESEWLESLKGTTPVKGVDYYTEADKAEIVSSVLNSLTSAEGVSV